MLCNTRNVVCVRYLWQRQRQRWGPPFCETWNFLEFRQVRNSSLSGLSVGVVHLINTAVILTPVFSDDVH